MGRGLAMLVIAAACGGGHKGGGDAGGDGGGGNDGPVIAPPSSCTVPPEGALVDTSASTNVVGDGTPASCTTAALQAAVTMGGMVRFDCGAAPLTITLTAAITINNVANADQ